MKHIEQLQATNDVALATKINNSFINTIAIELMTINEPVKVKPATNMRGGEVDHHSIYWPDGRCVDITPHSYSQWMTPKGMIRISGAPAQPKTKSRLRWEGGNCSIRDYHPGEMKWEHDAITWSNILGYNQREWKCGINISEKKTPDKIAKEIKGRFMDKYMEQWPKSVEIRDAKDKNHNAYMAKRKLLEDKLGVKWSPHCEESFTVEGLKLLDFHLHLSGNITLKLRSIKADNAIKIIEYMKELAGKDGEL
jgi:hypothetical protein